MPANRRTGQSSSTTRASPPQSIGRTLNPEILQCLENELKLLKNTASKYQYTLQKAISSLEQYPKKIYSGAEAQTLKGVGPKTARTIDKYLKDNNINLGDPPPTNSTTSSQELITNENNSQICSSNDNTTASKKKSTRKYVPKFKTAAWAIMIAMYRYSKEKNCESATKKIIIPICETLTETPMEKSSNSSHYTGWNSISTLVKKDLVKSHKRGKYSLTQKGRALARRLHRAEKEFADRDFSWQETEEELSSSSENDESEEDEETTLSRRQTDTTTREASKDGKELSKKRKKALSKRSENSTTSSFLETQSAPPQLGNSSSSYQYSSQEYEFDPDLDSDLLPTNSQQEYSSQPLLNTSFPTSKHSKNYNRTTLRQESLSESQPASTTTTALSECPIFCIDSDDEDESASDSDSIEMFYDYENCPVKLSFLDDRNKEVSTIDKCKLSMSAGCPVLMIQCKYPKEYKVTCKKLWQVIFDYEPQSKECDDFIVVQGKVNERRLKNVKESRDLLKNLVFDSRLLPTFVPQQQQKTSTSKGKTINEHTTTQSWSQISSSDEEQCVSTTSSCQFSIPDFNGLDHVSNSEYAQSNHLETVPPFSSMTEQRKNPARKRKEILFDDEDDHHDEDDFESLHVDTNQFERRKVNSMHCTEREITCSRPDSNATTSNSSRTIMPPPSFIPSRNLPLSSSASGGASTLRPLSSETSSSDKSINFTDYLNSDSDRSSSSERVNSNSERREKYKIKLIIDQRERTGRGSDRKQFCEKLCRAGIDAEVSQLGLGDMIWVAQKMDQSGAGLTSISTAQVLDVIVERKDINDLASSIKDGRYREQKFRLNQCGCSNVFYLIERDFKDQDQISHTSLETAMCKMISEGIGVKHTPSLEASIAFLQHLNAVLCELIDENGIEPYKLMVTNPLDDGPQLFNPTLAQYNQMFSKKNFEVKKKEIFARQLQAVDRCSAQVAESITNAFPTHEALSAAFKKHGETALENVPLMSAVDQISTKRVGKSLSKRLYLEFTQ
ncbi:hypothetical protein C9374_014073 [Naegleria lovaniensis]|uniref:Crossover junction endonuclease MUS81 n=1 Tax=Naegleria lovaniensis TaxID=51637 RepID=A0AA88KPJ7_NAELO|nr:uncharacterized protein C9374_014073 [Naegleria lovaniensis]KAG2389513.1 hypothetical protein C9374_014073 [Naegleria lovaniensis]